MTDFSEEEDFSTAQADQSTIIAQFASEDGTVTGPPVDIPVNLNTEQLGELLNGYLENVHLFCLVATHCRRRKRCPICFSSMTPKLLQLCNKRLNTCRAALSR